MDAVFADEDIFMYVNIQDDILKKSSTKFIEG